MTVQIIWDNDFAIVCSRAPGFDVRKLLLPLGTTTLILDSDHAARE